MVGKIPGFVAMVKDKAPHVLTTHCVLHRQALASKTLPKKLKEVMGVVVQTVNYIRGRALNHRLFQIFCDEIGPEHCVTVPSRGRDVDIIQASGKIVAFKRKLPTWSCRVESGNLANFPILDNILTEDGKRIPVQIFQEVENHLEVLRTNILMILLWNPFGSKTLSRMIYQDWETVIQQ
ncbi:protein FAM200C-like [Oratosquilla oratoria]|uniref:protein FAM200C-like n=1 Tax=Oratosquilla oratoria TaxID=337810 RepID=UPI003F758B5A